MDDFAWQPLPHSRRDGRRLKSLVKTVIQAGLSPVERALLRNVKRSDYVPVFVVGPPRSGTTLLYQLITRRYRFCYLSNFMMRFPRTPLSAALLSFRWGSGNPPGDYRSRYGTTFGWNAPSQGRRLWCEHLPEFPHELSANTISREAKDRISDIVETMQGLARAPFVNKWPPNSLRLPLLAEIFPRALFVALTRDREAMAASILRARADICRQGSGWFSVKPEGYEHLLSETPVRQVGWQLDRIEETIDRDSTLIGRERFVTVRYEDLVDRPRRILEEIGRFYRGTSGAALTIRNDVPNDFRRDSATAGKA